MSSRTSTTIEILAFILFILILVVLYDPMKFTLSTNKSIDIDNPVTISAGETIDISVSRGKGDWSVYVYFDNDTENKIKLDSNFFSFTGSIKAPITRGVHALTIEVSVFENRTYYYLIE